MWRLDPRRSAVALWAAWVVAGAVGGGLATLLSLAGMGAWLNGGTDELTFLAYEVTFATVAAFLQYLVLRFATSTRRSTVLWLPATMVAITVYVGLNALWAANLNNILEWLSTTFPGLDPESTTNIVFELSGVAYALAFGVVQGLVLVVMTGRKASVGIWIGGNLLGLLTATFIARLVPFGANGLGLAFVMSNALFAGGYAIGTGLALMLILRMRRRATAPPVPAAVPTLQGEG